MQTFLHKLPVFQDVNPSVYYMKPFCNKDINVKYRALEWYRRISFSVANYRTNVEPFSNGP